MNDERTPGERKVGIYDRPASADRPRRLPIIAIVAAVVVALAVLVMYVVR